MFFRRETPRDPTFAERLENLKSLGFRATSSNSSAHVTRDGIGAVIEDRPGQRPHVQKAGLAIGGEIGLLVNGGYQMFWKTPARRRVPALASQLKHLHSFEEDLREGLGLPSLYNESLGTTSDLHMYDRLERRDEGDAHKPWDAKMARSEPRRA